MGAKSDAEARQELMWKMGASCAPFMSLKTRYNNHQRKLRREAQKKERMKRKSEAPQVVELSGGEGAPVEKMELRDREVSGTRTAINSMVTLLMVGACAVLLIGVAILLKGLGNNAESEYPSNLKHRGSTTFVDLELG